MRILQSLLSKRLRLPRLFVLLPIGLAFPALAFHVGEDRDALWRVVQVCVANRQLTGASFPCLSVNLSGGVEHGYAILRPPFGKRDTILTPTTKIAGIEDPSLQAADAPNYFEDAWNARTFLSDETERPLARSDVALVVNSRASRTQDQLHIHLGCLSADVKRTLQAAAPELSETRWTALKRPVRGLAFWARRIAQETLADRNPFRLVADDMHNPNVNMAQLTIVVAGSSSIEGGDGFIIMVARSDGSSAGEDVLDFSCSS
jgi:CDP-diacylglycerol pyrophosphatase